MTPEQLQAMNVAIAEKMGRKYHKPTSEEIASGSYYQYEPNYTSSLDACAEFEKTLTGMDLWNYCCKLSEIERDLAKQITATPLQRCEAFCRLHKIGPFEEGK